MRQIILSNSQSPGDIVMLTAAVRDLHKQIICPSPCRVGVVDKLDAEWNN